MAAKKKPVDSVSLSDLGIDAGDVGLAGAWTRVEAFETAPPRQAGTVVSDEGEGADKLVEFLASKKFI
jgi:electron transfer flavoprotein beta subunit